MDLTNFPLSAAQDTSTGGTIVGFILLIAILVGIFFGVRALIRKGRSTTSSRREFNALPPEEQQRKRDLKDATKAVAKAEKSQEKAVKSATKNLETARNPPKLAELTLKPPEESLLGGTRKFTLYEDRLASPEGSQPLRPDLIATVDTAGNIAQSVKSRSTLTRMGVGTVVAGPVGLLVGAVAKKNKTQTLDTRELYLLIDGGTWMSSAACHPDQGAKVRAFAQQVTLAARNVEKAKELRKLAIERAEHDLAATRANRSGIESAQAKVSRLEGDAPPALEPPQ